MRLSGSQSGSQPVITIFVRSSDCQPVITLSASSSHTPQLLISDSSRLLFLLNIYSVNKSFAHQFKVHQYSWDVRHQLNVPGHVRPQQAVQRIAHLQDIINTINSRVSLENLRRKTSDEKKFRRKKQLKRTRIQYRTIHVTF